ncbi:MAG TPA: DinB family protein [Dehalococcoidia bacterium]|nr:DinB family protein [Dehalococcoidia bacterium]
MGTRSDALATRFEQAVADFATTVEACSDAQWAAPCSAERWTVAQTAQHVSGQFPLEMEFITAAAEGKPLPGYSWDDVNGKNDARAANNVAVTKAAVLKELREGAASTAAYIRALTDEQLDRTGSLPLAGGATVTTQQLIEGGVLTAHVTGHLESIRAAG